MKSVIATWKIIGNRPLMQSNYKKAMEGVNPPAVMEAEKADKAPKKPVVKKNVRAARKDPFNEAEDQLYQVSEGFEHPYLAFFTAILNNLTGYEVKGVGALSGLVPRLVFPLDDEKFILCDPETLDAKKPRPLTAKEWQMDSRRAVNKKKGGIIVHRPKWPKWGGLLRLEVDVEPFKEPDGFLDVLTVVLDVCGRYGMGAGRMRFDEERKRWGGLGLGKFHAELRK